MSSEPVLVKITREERIPRDVAEHIGAEFLDWLDAAGFELRPKSGVVVSASLVDLGYTELAAAFMEEWG